MCVKRFVKQKILVVHGENGIENEAPIKKWQSFVEKRSRTNLSTCKSMTIMQISKINTYMHAVFCIEDS